MNGWSERMMIGGTPSSSTKSSSDRSSMRDRFRRMPSSCRISDARISWRSTVPGLKRSISDSSESAKTDTSAPSSRSILSLMREGSITSISPIPRRILLCASPYHRICSEASIPDSSSSSGHRSGRRSSDSCRMPSIRMIAPRRSLPGRNPSAWSRILWMLPDRRADGREKFVKSPRMCYNFPKGIP